MRRPSGDGLARAGSCFQAVMLGYRLKLDAEERLGTVIAEQAWTSAKSAALAARDPWLVVGAMRELRAEKDRRGPNMGS